MAVPLTNAQKARRGLLPTQTYTGSTFARPGVKPKQKPLQDFRTMGGGGGGLGGGQTQIAKLPPKTVPGLGVPAFNPNININPYRNMIGGDWEVQGMESEMNARMGRARGDFTSQIRQALIDLGVTDTSKLGSLGGYIDADTISKAAQNKYSQTAQISQAETAKRAQTEAALAARGMLSSGQLTKSTEDIIAEGESSRYGALRDFLGAGSAGLSGLADMNEQYASQLAQARFAAAQRAADLYNSAEMWDWENQMGRYAAPAPPPAIPTFAAGPGWGASIGNTGADRYGYSPTRPNRPGKPGFRPF